ncbi:MAG: glutamate synthase large subunit [Armatimonadetes bacterium]|nr:glutamate synthase large subunit [Armatimonadota bacterium]MDE2205712.1 glutamate synthase large subunit [Armatimonadota bacterium]
MAIERWNWLPGPHGLYDPQFEGDACGVGFVASIHGLRSHRIVQDALRVLVNLQHRGACGCDPETGDGAGLLMQIPDSFYRGTLIRRGTVLPPAGSYGVVMLFLPAARLLREECCRELEAALRQEGLQLLAWRDVPVNPAAIGKLASETMPAIAQVFVSAPGVTGDGLERRLYVARRAAENRLAHSVPDAGFYVCSCSCRTVVYKGLLRADQIAGFYSDLTETRVVSALAMVHQRFSTNTFPTWGLAHPYRYVAHNGEINTIRGNRNWMRAREAQLTSTHFGPDLKKLFPLVSEAASDSAMLDQAFELLVMGGRSMAHAVMMLMPEAWGNDEGMDPDRRAFYEYAACQMEPWDGPAAVTFTDGKSIGAVLDRNGLRPARYLVTDDDVVVLSSETGVLEIDPRHVVKKGRLQPGRIFLVDTESGRIVSDDEVKRGVCAQHPYRAWLDLNKVDVSSLPIPQMPVAPDSDAVVQLQRAFGYTLEDMERILAPMAVEAEQPLGSMGIDTPLAVLSDRPQLLYNYFKQLFAQVTNPPIDPIREGLVMAVVDYIGRDGNLLDETPRHCHQLKLDSPILTTIDLERLRQGAPEDIRCVTLPGLFDATSAPGALEAAIDDLCERANRAVLDGAAFIIVSDRGVDQSHIPIPGLLTLAAVHHHLVRKGNRTQVGLIVESGEAREVMHFALLIGYGASAVNPYLAFDTLATLQAAGLLPEDLSQSEAGSRYIRAVVKGLLKTIARMGVSTLQSYRGAQLFEAIGLSRELIERYFTGTPSRVGGIGLRELEHEARMRHAAAWPDTGAPVGLQLDIGGLYQWSRFGERHAWNPETVASLRHAAASGRFADYQEFSNAANEAGKSAGTLRSLLQFRPGRPVPLNEVEPESAIIRRFATGAMSLGSISREAHETIAAAMNRLGARSNTGEGGEDPARYTTAPGEESRRSAIKQIASARFGVTTEYLVNASELQIKMAQGAKPGEGGELPGGKVDEYIAGIRHSTPGVTLISPPPHHDIYSIEDLAQLIFDLKNVNPTARISVKLVAEAGVGTVAAGVAKARADVVLISGHDGGTGASPLSSIRHCGIPWELGLAEAQQVLVMNNLRERVRLQVDGQLKTGRDVAVAALLGAEEFGFSTAPLVSLGCVMMRVCHLNTCPVGIATQDPVLRQRFAGKPEQVINYFVFVARELRGIMAELGFRTVDEMVGRADMLEMIHHDQRKRQQLDLSMVLSRPDAQLATPRRCVTIQDSGLDEALDHEILPLAREAIAAGMPVTVELPVYNRNRAVGAMLSGEIARACGQRGLPDDTVRIRLTGSAGQSLGAFLVPGVSITLEGDANDYLGKGMSGGRIVAFPPAGSPFDAGENVIAGNTLLYGATGGETYLSGVVGERFAVRNSGANAVVEGAGDHACEYMTGGTVVVLGSTGRNFAAGMSGGVAWVWDPAGRLRACLHDGGAKLLATSTPHAHDAAELHRLVARHHEFTGSRRAGDLLKRWSSALPEFVRVISPEYEELICQQTVRALAG